MTFKHLLAGLFTLVAFQLSAHSQTQMLLELSIENDGEAQLENFLSDFQEAAEFQIHGRIQEINRVCNPTDKQLQKLRVAAKGALNAFLEKETEEKRTALRRYQEQAGIVKKDDDGAEPAGPAILRFLFFFTIRPGEFVERESRWNKSLEKILSGEQKEKLEEVRLEQQKFLQATAVEHYVAKLELRLFLSAEQRAQIQTVVEDNFSLLLVKLLKHKPDAESTLAEIVGGVGPEPEYTELVREILTEKQLKEWIRFVEPELRRIKDLPEW